MSQIYIPASAWILPAMTRIVRTTYHYKRPPRRGWSEHVEGDDP
jgi:hypothetical protein